MAMQTIWGQVQDKTNICRGVISVGTASHGGLLLAHGYAKKHLPSKIVNLVPFYNNYFCFEEDCDYNIPLFFIPELIPKMVKSFWPNLAGQELDEKVKKHARYIYDAIKRYYEGFLNDYPMVVLRFKDYCQFELNFTDDEMKIFE